MKLFNVAGALAALAVSFVAAPASADIYLLQYSDAQSGLASPYGQVEVTQGVNALNFSVTLFDGLKFTDTGAHYAFSFSLTGEPAVGLAGAPAGFTLVTNPNSLPNSPFGDFDYGIACSVCEPNTGGYAGPLNFSITGTGLTLAMLAPATGLYNGNPVLFAADTIAPLAPGSTQAVTGTIGGGIPGSVPEPATWAMMILGFAMVGAGLRLRRREEPTLA
jgi:hypothetical protein